MIELFNKRNKSLPLSKGLSSGRFTRSADQAIVADRITRKRNLRVLINCFKCKESSNHQFYTSGVDIGLIALKKELNSSIINSLKDSSVMQYPTNNSADGVNLTRVSRGRKRIVPSLLNPYPHEYKQNVAVKHRGNLLNVPEDLTIQVRDFNDYYLLNPVAREKRIKDEKRRIRRRLLKSLLKTKKLWRLSKGDRTNAIMNKEDVNDKRRSTISVIQDRNKKDWRDIIREELLSGDEDSEDLDESKSEISKETIDIQLEEIDSRMMRVLEKEIRKQIKYWRPPSPSTPRNIIIDTPPRNQGIIEVDSSINIIAPKVTPFSSPTDSSSELKSSIKQKKLKQPYRKYGDPVSMRPAYIDYSPSDEPLKYSSVWYIMLSTLPDDFQKIDGSIGYFILNAQAIKPTDNQLMSVMYHIDEYDTWVSFYTLFNSLDFDSKREDIFYLNHHKDNDETEQFYYIVKELV